MSPAASRPNILFLIADQMQGRVLHPDHPCLTPHLDQLAARGVRFPRAYTPNPLCSPARASLMTGLLPHNHGVLTVTHGVDADQSCLRLDKPHWAQRLVAAGYRTGYFGKWHIERSYELARFGWQTDCTTHSDLFKQRAAQQPPPPPLPQPPATPLRFELIGPEGYGPALLYEVIDEPVERRGLGIIVDLALDWLSEATRRPQPWCAFVSVQEPHDPYRAPRPWFERYDPDCIALPASARDDLSGRPNLYKKAQNIFAGLTDLQRRRAMACYWASISEIDQQFGRLLRAVERAGQLENTLVVLTSDHGELLGAHGLWMKNVGAFEEVYNVPLIVAGPGVARGAASAARVGLHDLCPTLCDLAGAQPIHNADCRSFAGLLADPAADAHWQRGFAEYHGTRQLLTQRILWDGPWKLVHNGFDFDELYNLETDPHELHNLAADPAYADQLRRLMALAWDFMKRTNDHTLVKTHYPPLRLAPLGPGAGR